MKMALEMDGPQVFRMMDAMQCPGCPSNLAAKLVLQIVFQVCEGRGQQPIIIGQSCGAGRNVLLRSGIGTHDSGAVGMLAAMAVRGLDRPVVVIDGDGQVDMGLDDLSGAFHLGYPYMHVVCDNQGYAASGTHATGTTDLLARVSTRPTGRDGHPLTGRLVPRKHPAMMMIFSGARYTATASPVHALDLERKLINALDNQPSFVQVFTPCNAAWGFEDRHAARITDLGVKCGIWPLWEWKGGVFRRTARLARDGIDGNLQEYLKLQRRYGHLADADIQEMRQYVDDLNGLVDRLAETFSESRPEMGAAGTSAEHEPG